MSRLRRAPKTGPHYDVLIIGSGFGGSVSALRLTEKGYRVGVLEAGQRFADEDFGKSTWNLRKFVWAPALGLLGVQRIHLLKDVVVLAGAGVGGGSLNYANTLYKPPSPFFKDPQWAHITDWESELTPYYDQARKMLGVVPSPHMTPADVVMKSVADDMGVGDTFTATPVGVYFGQPGQKAEDPFFGGVGPERTGCTECGSCMSGCRVGAKNTLVKNYLGLAEKAGAVVHPLTTVTSVRPGSKTTWEVETHATGTPMLHRTVYTADHVILAAGTWGTQKLLHKMRDTNTLPKLSDRLGILTRTNSEAILGAASRTADPNNDFSRGVAITSSFYPDPDTHVEPVRYGRGRNPMAFLQTALSDGDTRREQLRGFFNFAKDHPRDFRMLFKQKQWGERVIIMLVMQSLNNSITTFTKKGAFGRRKLTSKQGHGQPNPTWIRAGNEATRRVAEKINGVAGGTWGQSMAIPLTAHFLGGCTISDSPETGVIDPYHRVFGYPTMSVVDGSAISANLGVNPSLSIASQAERAAALWPNKGEVDRRPAQGDPYVSLAAIPPHSPVVPAHAPAALRLPLTPVPSRQQVRRADPIESKG